MKKILLIALLLGTATARAEMNTQQYSDLFVDLASVKIGKAKALSAIENIADDTLDNAMDSGKSCGEIVHPFHNKASLNKKYGDKAAEILEKYVNSLCMLTKQQTGQ